MKERKNLIIGILLVLIILMAVGYAALSATLTINGVTEIDSSWCIGFSGVEITKTPTATTTHTQIFNTNPLVAKDCVNNTLTFEFNVGFVNQGDYVQYTLTITNFGSIDAEVASLTTPDPNWVENGGINFITSGLTVGQKLVARTNTTFTLMARWDESSSTLPEVMKKAFLFEINFKQA